MRINFEDVIDKHKGMPALILAHGPSLNQYNGRLEGLKNCGHILFGCNDWFNFYKITPHYWVQANNMNHIKIRCPNINQFMIPFLYANTVDVTPMDWVEKNIRADYLPFDQRNYGKQKTIQEKLQEYCKVDFYYHAGDTVAVHMIAFALLMGCSPVYFTGIDLDYRLGYANKKPVPRGNHLTHFRDNILKDLVRLRDSAKNIGVDLINLNENSTFDLVRIGLI